MSKTRNCNSKPSANNNNNGGSKGQSKPSNQRNNGHNKSNKPSKDNLKPKSNGFQVSKSGSKDDKLPRYGRNFEKDMEEGTQSSSRNDISTWNKNPQMLKAAGSLPFSSILGDPYNRISANEYASVPGIISLTYSPNIGSSIDSVAFNKTFEAMYSYEIHANSRDYKYDFPDVAFYVTAGGEVFAAIEEAKRIYGIFKAYEEPNRYLVNALVTALGWDPQDVRRNLSKMWFDINDLILQTRQLWIPSTIPVFSRWNDLNAHVYTDAPGAKSQMYVFVRSNYWMVSEVGVNTGTALVPATYNANAISTSLTPTYVEFTRDKSVMLPYVGMRWEPFRDMIQHMIDALVASGSRGSLYGDMLAAFGANNIYAMPELDSSYRIAPEYNAMILAQIENASFSSAYQRMLVQNQGVSGSRLEIVPIWADVSNPTVKFDFKTTDASVLDPSLFPATSNQILNAHMDGQPTPEWIMEATRFKVGPLVMQAQKYAVTPPTLDDKSGLWTEGTVTPGTIADQYYYQPQTSGTEIFHFARLFKLGVNNQLAGNLECRQLQTGFTQDSTVSTHSLDVMAFDWHPFLYTYYPIWENDTPEGTVTGEPIVNWVRAYGDFDNYTTVSTAEMVKLNQTAIYSAFGVPMNIG
nr:putative capsid [Marmot picobirnavirus]